jgi:ATP/maltotriose-dependent transcriptional regulator MalT
LELIALGEQVVHPQHSWGPSAVARIQANGESGACQLSGHLDPQSRPSIQSTAIEPSSESETGDVVSNLSRREMIILRMLMEGASNKTIALNHRVNREGAYERRFAETSIAKSHPGGNLGARPC